MDEVGLDAGRVGGEAVFRVGDEAFFLFRVDEDAPGGEPAPDGHGGHIVCDPMGGRAAEEVNPRPLDCIVPRHLGAFVEGLTAIPEVDEEVDHDRHL